MGRVRGDRALSRDALIEFLSFREFFLPFGGLCELWKAGLRRKLMKQVLAPVCWHLDNEFRSIFGI